MYEGDLPVLGSGERLHTEFKRSVKKYDRSQSAALNLFMRKDESECDSFYETIEKVKEDKKNSEATP